MVGRVGHNCLEDTRIQDESEDRILETRILKPIAFVYSFEN